MEKSVFLSGSGYLTPPPLPLSGSTIKKTLFYCVSTLTMIQFKIVGNYEKGCTENYFRYRVNALQRNILSLLQVAFYLFVRYSFIKVIQFFLLYILYVRRNALYIKIVFFQCIVGRLKYLPVKFWFDRCKNFKLV